MSEEVWVRLAVMGGLDPWGRVTLSDIITAVKVRRQVRFQDNLQLAKMVAAMFAGKPEAIREMIPED